jgi:hypothetical protein
VLYYEQFSVAMCDGARAGKGCSGVIGSILLLLLQNFGDMVLISVALHCLLVARARILVVCSGQLWFVGHGFYGATLLPGLTQTHRASGARGIAPRRPVGWRKKLRR